MCKKARHEPFLWNLPGLCGYFSTIAIGPVFTSPG
jgi:hypothetical protein